MNPVIAFFVWLWTLVTFPVRWLFGDRSALRKQRVYRARMVEDLPDNPEPGLVYLAGDPHDPWAASMLCPCGCNDTIELNLLRQVRPSWTAEEHPDGSVTLDPSVWRQKGCGSHFVMRRGHVEWY